MEHINKKLRELKTLEGTFQTITMDSLSKNPYDLSNGLNLLLKQMFENLNL
jgi:hypothetical protein